MFSTSGDVNRDVTITFVGKDNASVAMRSISGTASRTTSIAKKLGTTLKYVGIAAAAALAAGAAAAAKALIDATKAAYYDQIGMEALARTQMKAQDATKAQTKATSDLIDKLELQTGIADDELRPALAALASTGMNVGESQRELSVAMDVSVARHKSLQTVAEALAKAYNGQLTGLQRLGVKVTDDAGKALTFSQVLGTLKDRFGGAAKAAGKTDPLKRLGAAWHQLQEDLGKGFLPILKEFALFVIHKVVPWVKDNLVPAVKQFSRWIQDEAVPFIKDKLIPALSDMYTWFKTKIYPSLKDTAKQLGQIVTSVGRLTEAIGELTGAKNGEGTVRFFDLITQSINNALIPMKGYLYFLQHMISAWAWIIDHAQSVVDAFENVASHIPHFPSLPGWLPGAANGGYVARAMGGRAGGMTLVGEHGPELISNRGFVKTHSQSMGMGGGGVVINVNGALDPVGTARQIRNILAKGDRVGGRATLGLA